MLGIMIFRVGYIVVLLLALTDPAFAGRGYGSGEFGRFLFKSTAIIAAVVLAWLFLKEWLFDPILRRIFKSGNVNANDAVGCFISCIIIMSMVIAIVEIIGFVISRI
jgi:hypothetical protein